MTDMQAERDRLAELCGWRRQAARIDQSGYPVYGWIRGDDPPWVIHPFPPGDLTALAAAWPDGWGWWRSSAEWLAQAPETDFIRVRDTGDEYAARLRLTIAVLEAGKGATT